MISNLSLLYADTLYPYISGGTLKSLSLAKLAQDCFESVTIFAMDEKNQYNGLIDDVNVVQEIKFNNYLDKLSYFAAGLFSRSFSLKVPKSALYNKNTTLFQLESPYIYNLLKKESINKFILDEHNVNWEFLKFPSYNPKQILFNKIAYNRNIKIELEALTAASHILVCSERDKQQILNRIPHIVDKITIIPNCVFASEYSEYIKSASFKNEIGKGVDELCSVVFVGLLSHPPNKDAVRIICSHIAPNFGDEVTILHRWKKPS